MSKDPEKNTQTQAAEEKPTTPRDVTPQTPIANLNLNWSEKELPERIRTKHVNRLHPYLGKYIPQLVEIFIRKYFSPGQMILDPFAGSGTTLVQAKELGLNAIGCDISEFNVTLCKAKTQKYNLPEMEKEVKDVLEKTRLVTKIDKKQRTLIPLKTPTVDKLNVTDEYLKRWFAPQALVELITFRDIIAQGNYQYRDLLRIILSRAARSARLTTHFDLDFPKKPVAEPYYCYKHDRTCQPTTEAFQFLNRYCIDTIRRIKEYANLCRMETKVEIYHADSRNVPFPPVDGVITSPPYVGLIDYHEQHAYAYHLLNLSDQRELEIGAAAKGASKNAKKNYSDEISAVFANVLNSLKDGGRMIVIANDTANLYGDIAQSLNVEREDFIKRHVNRRTGRRATEFFESIFIWRKKTA